MSTKSDAPSWSEIKRHEWSEIEAAYKAGVRDKETVCAWMAYKAALRICKGWPAGSFDELLTEGYIAALRKWPDYDPRQATENGISGFVYKAAERRMRNAAPELFTSSGKRKHRETDKLPVLVVQSHEITERLEHDARGAVTTSVASNEADVDYFTNDSDSGGAKDKAVTAAANRAARSKSFKPEPWTTRVNAPYGASSRVVERAAHKAVVFRIGELLGLLPPEECALVSQYWGVNGEQRLTLQQLAERRGCSPAAAHRRLEKLLADLKALAGTKR
jgi:RNA polymerase sigma factor (sigma-70 family)